MIRCIALLCILCLAPNVASSEDAPSDRGEIFNHPIPNIPSKSILAVIVDCPPGARNPPHPHAGSAFITAYVLQGSVRSQVDDGAAKVYRAGECFTGNPGSHHRSENASLTEPAKRLAIFVLDTHDAPLTTLDKK
jgi:quercetin dioxygenase-like cupin family protein